MVDPLETVTTSAEIEMPVVFPAACVIVAPLLIVKSLVAPKTKAPLNVVVPLATVTSELMVPLHVMVGVPVRLIKVQLLSVT